MPRNLNSRRLIAVVLVFAFLGSLLQPSYAQELTLPVPGTMVNLSPTYVPVLVKGLRVHPENPLLFDFILDTGKSGLKVNSPEFKDESEKLIKYFLASLTIKEDDLWVNLSPYEKSRIVPEQLGQTELGRDMLAQDYILKQLTASLIYPEKQLGKEFWNTVYAKAQREFGTSNIPVNTFNKVWIVADKAKILERDNVGYVVAAHLKVMLEEDYLALENHTAISQANRAHTVASQVVREIVIPELEKEVNQGQHFAPLRQIFYSMILATWYKSALNNALLNQVYSNKGKTGGVLSDDPAIKEKIYEQYLKAYKKGVFNYIKDDINTGNKQPMPRKYFSGGLARDLGIARILDRAQTATPEELASMDTGDLAMETVNMTRQVQEIRNSDAAMTARQIETLKGAETQISKILEGQFQRGDITDVVYKNALQNTYKNLYEWTTDDDIFRIDPSIRQTNLEAIREGRWDDIIEAYRQEVAFGTAGIRGKAVLTFDDLQKFVQEGPLGNFLKGPNTINAFKLLKTTAGVIRFAKETGRKRIVIGYDSRIAGEQFAQMIARLFIAQSTPDYQFKIFLFDEASPFPELSFGITTDDVKGDIGILLSASHNPADYNGYKITLANGSQLNQKAKDAVVAAIAKVQNSEIVLAHSLADAKPGQITWLGADKPLAGKDYHGFKLIDMHSLHVGQTQRFILNKQAVAQYGKEVRIGYAAFNGAGFKAVPRLLREAGFTNLQVISKLQKLDGTFPAWKFGEQPDPGDPISADIAVREFVEENGQKAFDDLDILIGTDPDADRMGLIVKVPEVQQKFFGKYRLLSANDAWTLLLWYRLTMKKQMGLLKNPANHTVVFSHVTTDALEAVAREFGIEPSGKMLDMNNIEDRGGYLSGHRTWVGFTYLAEALEDMEQAGKYVEMLAEESNGVSIQGHTKEKDGTLAAVLLAEIAAYAKSLNTTIFELLDKVYSQIGHYATANKPLPRVGSFEKAAGISEKIKIIQKSQEWGLLANQHAGTASPFMIAGKKVIGAVQFASGRIDKSHYEGVPDEGVRFFFEDETMKPGDNFTNSRNYITIRASGTSQALRFYTQIFSKESTPEQKAFNYHEAERIALEAQKQILEDVGLDKHLSLVAQQLESFNAPSADRAALAQAPGGIDLNVKNMSMDVSGQGIDMKFDPAMIAAFQHGNFSGIVPVIIRITPIKSVLLVMGLDAASSHH